MASHADARTWAHDGFVQQFGREPTLLEVQFVQAVALLESGYGAGWKGEGAGSWNMGAVQAGKPPCDPARSFLYTDSHPNKDGTSTKYQICFRKYPGPVDGMADVARILYKQMSITPTSITAVSSQMYDKHYYEGFGPTREVRIANHVKALTSGLTKITSALGEPMPPISGEGDSPMAPPKTPPAVGDGSLSDFSERLESALRSDAELGHYIEFGPLARIVVKDYQRARGLKADGLVGPKTLQQIESEIP